MKKIKLLGILSLASTLIVGCSCSKVDEKTYESAVSTYQNTDAISFSRVEVITKNGETTYTRKKIDASYVFNANKDVYNMSYSYILSENNSAGGSNISETIKYYYSSERETLYSYSKIAESQLERYKYSDVTYNSKFNVNVCSNSDCLLLVMGNFAPIYELNEITEFRIEDNKGTGIAYYKGVCPVYEACENNGQMIEYTLTINEDGNIESLSYDVVNGDTTHSIKYTFLGYGSNNVNITFPSDLESYIEK